MTKTTKNEDIAEVKAAPAGETPGEPESGEAGSAEGAGGELPLEVEVEAPEPEPTPEPTAEEKLAELEAKCRDLNDKYLRAAAELDNVRKRTRKEIEDARIDAQSRALREMLPVIDNLERAVAHAESHGDSTAAVIEGVKLVLRQFMQALERLNVRPVLAQDQPFDPNEHEAVSQAETSEAAPGTVIEVLQTGYKFGDRLLRPALVVVAKAPPEPAAGPNGKSPTADEGDGAG